jgi:hypothetical protein
MNNRFKLRQALVSLTNSITQAQQMSLCVDYMQLIVETEEKIRKLSEEEEPNEIQVVVLGRTGSGKTVVQGLIAAALSQDFDNIEINWGPDGNPGRSDLDNVRIANKISPKTKILIREQNLRMNGSATININPKEAK